MNMKKKIFHYMCFLISLSVVCTFILTLTLCYPLFFEHTKQEVKDEAVYLTYVFNHNLSDPLKLLHNAHTQTRITWIDINGNILFDNSAEAAHMENHLLRPEIQSALDIGIGEAYRISTTLGSNTYYYAVKLNDGTILRLSRTNISAYDMLRGSLPILFAMMLAIYVIALLAARRMARNIIAPINAINLEHPIINDLYEELNPMLLRLENQNEQIRQQMKKLKNQQREFTTIINNIEEGLILINHSYKILSVNFSALEILNADRKINYIDKNLFTLVNNDALYQATQSVMKGERQEFYLPMGSKTYQIIASPVTKNDKVKGAVILFVDITEKRMAEKMRQEFSANVSHELKTPLTSISGFAELLQNNMVRPADVPLFAGKIYKEAQRLINLVQDIIKVSQLDEKNSSFMKEPINLAAVCKQTVLYLNDKALKKQIKLNFSAEPGCEITAVRQLIDELVFNLIENAIKYNKPNGQVNISLKRKPTHIALSVKDTGIGISEEDLPHVFERFYRADKSRSQINVEGTGLGLAIVKHIAEYHHAQLTITSKINKGTTITIKFPLV